jgi:hypothetical protein
MPHKNLLDVVSSGLCGGQDDGVRDVGGTEPIQQLRECSFKMPRKVRTKGALNPSCCRYTFHKFSLSLTCSINYTLNNSA